MDNIKNKEDYNPDIVTLSDDDGKEYTFTKTIDLDVLNADELVYIGIDGSHHNEYVAGNIRTAWATSAISPRSTVCAPCS